MLALVAATFAEQRSARPVPALPALTIQCSVSAVALSAVAAVAGDVAPPGDASFWIAVAWLIVFATFGGYGLYWIALRRGGVTTVNTLMFLMAPTTAVWGALMFGEPIGIATIAGLLVCLAAVAVVGRGAYRANRPASSTRERTPSLA